MPAKDLYHDTVKTALLKDGWTITDDPLSLEIGGRDLFVDLGAEKLLIADRGSQKIAVEVKSFISPLSGQRFGKRSRAIHSLRRHHCSGIFRAHPLLSDSRGSLSHFFL